MAPMIDMVFLLLVFFMCVSHLSDPAQAFDIDLPQAGTRPDQATDDALTPTVFVLADATVCFGGIPSDPDALTAGLSPLAQSNPSLRVRIKADRHTPWSTIQPVVDAVTNAGITRLLITSIEESTANPAEEQ